MYAEAGRLIPSRAKALAHWKRTGDHDSAGGYTMTAENFVIAAERTLDRLVARLGEAAPEVDTDIMDGVLTLQFPDGSEMVINRQEAVKQIWLAWSGGPARFDHRGGMIWVDPRSGNTLEQHMAGILAVHLGHPVDLPGD